MEVNQECRFAKLEATKSTNNYTDKTQVMDGFLNPSLCACALQILQIISNHIKSYLNGTISFSLSHARQVNIHFVCKTKLDPGCEKVLHVIQKVVDA